MRPGCARLSLGMLMVERTVAFSGGLHDERDEVHHMVYVILVIVVVVLFVIFFLARRKAVKRGFSYAPDSDSLGNKVSTLARFPRWLSPRRNSRPRSSRTRSSRATYPTTSSI